MSPISWLFQSKDSLQERAPGIKIPWRGNRNHSGSLSSHQLHVWKSPKAGLHNTALETPRICTGFPSQGTSAVLVSPRSRLPDNQVWIKRWNCCYNLFISGTTWLFLGSEKRQQHITKTHDFHGPSITLICWWKPASPICLMCLKLLSTQLLASRNTLRAFLFPLFLSPKSCRSELAQGTDTLLVQKHEGKHPWGIKLWQPEAAHSIGGFARRKCSSSDAKSASLMPAALLSVISAWQLLQDPCLVLFLGFIPAFQLSGPLCTHCDSIGNIMYVLAWVFLKELAPV